MFSFATEVYGLFLLSSSLRTCDILPQGHQAIQGTVFHKMARCSL